MASIADVLLKGLTDLSVKISQDQITNVADILCEVYKNGGRVFLAGAGRSGCIVRAFANRMMHLGFNCYVTGDITTPPIESALEQLAWLTCDALILSLRDALGLKNEDLIARHANLE